MTLFVPSRSVSDHVRAPSHVDGRVSVPWTHVLPLAVVLAFANGFWIISLRGAVGAIERTSEPFSAWWRESVLLVPVYVVAVLVAFAVARRWLGQRRPTLSRTAAVVALVAIAGTIAGTLLLVASSAIDYRLQVHALDHMSTVHPGCDAACLAARRTATLDLQLRSVGLGALLLAATDLVVVALVVAFRGGRVLIAGTRRPRDTRTPPVRLFLAAALIGAATIHAAVSPEHLGQWWAAGVFLVLLSAAEMVTALTLLLRRRRLQVASLVAAVAVSAVPLGVWGISRTSGLPFGPGAGVPEAIGIADVMACLLELVTLAVALGPALAGSVEPGRWPPYRLAIALVSVVAVTAIGLGASGIPGFASLSGGEETHHDQVGEAAVLP